MRRTRRRVRRPAPMRPCLSGHGGPTDWMGMRVQRKGEGGIAPGAHLVANATKMLFDQPLHEVDDSLPLGVGLRSGRYVSQQLIDVLLYRLGCWALPCGPRLCSLDAGRRCFCVETGHVWNCCYRCLLDLHRLGHGVTAWLSAASALDRRQDGCSSYLPALRWAHAAVVCKNRIRPTVLKAAPHLCSAAETHFPCNQSRNCVSEPHISTTPCCSLPGVGRACRTSQVRWIDACKRLTARMAPCGTTSDALQSCGRGAHGPQPKPHQLAPADGLMRSRGGPPCCACAKTIRLAPHSCVLVALHLPVHVGSICAKK